MTPTQALDGALKEHSQALTDQLTAWRRELHQHPELGFEEEWTAAYILKQLEGLPLEIHTRIATTGIAAILRAPKAVRPAVLLRADIDALPIQEIEGREYGSQIPGRMHACGHDGHTAMLLGAARILCDQRDQLDRDILFCFQPGEEGMGGARVMIEEGILELAEVGKVYGQHLWSGYDTGTVHVRPGPTMAGQDEIHVVLKGAGGHGAVPQETVDPIVAAAHVITALQSIVARNIDPMDAAVVTIGSLHAGTAQNIIPDEAALIGTLRHFNETSKAIIRKRVPEVIEHSARALGCTAEIDLVKGYPPTVNDPESATRAFELAQAIVGSENVIEPSPIAAAEDFSYFLNARPGAFVFIGSRNESRGITAPHHAYDFDIDESALPIGTEMLTRLGLFG